MRVYEIESTGISKA